MPTLFRFLFICAVGAGMVYGAMVALVTFVDPVERDVTVRIPSETGQQAAMTDMSAAYVESFWK